MLPRNSGVARMSACELEVRMILRWLREGASCWLHEGANCCSDVVARGRQLLIGCCCARASTIFSDVMVVRGRQLLVVRGRQLLFGCGCAGVSAVGCVRVPTLVRVVLT